MLNQSLTTRRGVVCPVLRDNLARPLRWIRVIYADNFPDPDPADGPSPDKRHVFECQVRAAHGLATVASDVDSVDTQLGANDDPRTKFDVPGVHWGTGSGFFQFHRLDDVHSGDDVNNPNSLYNFGHYTLVCQIPPRWGNEFSWIAGIMIDEP